MLLMLILWTSAAALTTREFHFHFHFNPGPIGTRPAPRMMWRLVTLLSALRSLPGQISFTCYLSDVRLYVFLSVFLSSGSVDWILPLSVLRMVLRILLRGCPGVYRFDEILAAELDFEKCSRSSEIVFWIFSFVSTCLMVSASHMPHYL